MGMALTQSKIRVILRWVHIVLGLVIMCYIYSPLSKYLVFKRMMQFIVIPVITFTGLWIWKFNAFNKFFKIK